MKETTAGIILVLIMIAISLFIGRNIKPDLNSDGGYDQRTENCGPGGTWC